MLIILLLCYKLTLIDRTITQIYEMHLSLCNVKSIIMKCRVTCKSNSGGGIQMNRALGAKFFKFGMVVGMGMMVSKTIANKLWSISVGHLA